MNKSRYEDDFTMNRNWIICAAALLLLAAGCEKSANNSSPATTPANPPAASATPNQAAPGQSAIPTREQANAANPANQPVPPPEPPQPFEIASGTPLTVVLTSTINSKNVTPGQEFDATLAAPVSVNEEEAIPKGSPVSVTVVNAKKQGAVKGEANLTIKLSAITVRGKQYPISSSSLSDVEKGKGKRSAVMTGGGAAVGALIGGLAGGGKGAAIGAGVGAGGGLAASAGTGGKNAEFPAESKLTFKLTHALTVDR
jgi:hypothetical protein